MSKGVGTKDSVGISAGDATIIRFRATGKKSTVVPFHGAIHRPKSEREVGPCPLCRVKMTLDMNDVHRYSRDHILRQANGYRARIYGDTCNIRVVCQRCNNMLALHDQCPAAVACALAVDPATGTVRRAQMKRRKYVATPPPTLADVWPKAREGAMA